MNKKKMTVGALIEALSKYPKDMIIVSPGYEGGYHDGMEPSAVMMFAANINKEWYYGPHEKDDNSEKHPEAKHFQAIVV